MAAIGQRLQVPLQMQHHRLKAASCQNRAINWADADDSRQQVRQQTAGPAARPLLRGGVQQDWGAATPMQ